MYTYVFMCVEVVYEYEGDRVRVRVRVRVWVRVWVRVTVRDRIG